MQRYPLYSITCGSYAIFLYQETMCAATKEARQQLVSEEDYETQCDDLICVTRENFIN